MRILRIRGVLAKLSCSRSWLYQQMAAGTFPRQIKLGPKAVGWLESDIDTFITQRIEASRAA